MKNAKGCFGSDAKHT